MWYFIGILQIMRIVDYTKQNKTKRQIKVKELQISGDSNGDLCSCLFWNMIFLQCLNMNEMYVCNFSYKILCIVI